MGSRRSITGNNTRNTTIAGVNPPHRGVPVQAAPKVDAVQRAGLHFPAVYLPPSPQVSLRPSANSIHHPIQRHEGTRGANVPGSPSARLAGPGPGKGPHWPPIYSPHPTEIHRKVVVNSQRPGLTCAQPAMRAGVIKPPVFKPQRPANTQSRVSFPVSPRMIRPAPPVLQRMVVTVAEAEDKKGVITRAATAIVSKESDVRQVHGGAYYVHENKDTSYQGIGDTEPLVIVAHGSAPSSYLCGCISFAPKLGGVKPEALAQQLANKGLPNTYRGMIHLNGCETGVEGSNGEPCFAERFARALAGLLGAIDVTVLGNKGVAATVASGFGAGQEVVTIKDPDTVDRIKKKGKPFLVDELADGSVKAVGAAYTMANFNLNEFPQPPKVATINTPLLRQTF